LPSASVYDQVCFNQMRLTLPLVPAAPLTQYQNFPSTKSGAWVLSRVTGLLSARRNSGARSVTLARLRVAPAGPSVGRSTTR